MAGKPAGTHLRDNASVMMGVPKGKVKTELKKGALRMKQFERPSNEKGGAPQEKVLWELLHKVVCMKDSELAELITFADEKGLNLLER